MNGILSNNNSDSKLLGVLAPKSKEPIETAGSLAMNVFHSWFEVNCYDEFSSSNPFFVDYSQYSDCGDTLAYSGFLSDFANAMSIIGTGCDVSASAGGSFDCGSSCGGGFTSFC